MKYDHSKKGKIKFDDVCKAFYDSNISLSGKEIKNLTEAMFKLNEMPYEHEKIGRLNVIVN